MTTWASPAEIEARQRYERLPLLWDYRLKVDRRAIPPVKISNLVTDKRALICCYNTRDAAVHGALIEPWDDSCVLQIGQVQLMQLEQQAARL